MRLCVALLLIAAASAHGEPIAAHLGSSHTHGKYFFTHKDYLNEGAIELANGGIRVIKVWFEDPVRYYSWNSQWPKTFNNYVEVAKHPYFRELFNRPFDTYVLTIFEEMGYQDGFADSRPAKLEQKFYDLTKHLLTTYRGTGKTFILAHHEGDWHVRPGQTKDQTPAGDATPTNLKGMIRWLNARQAGTDRARREVQDTDVKVYHAAEVNLVTWAMQGRPTVTNDVLPYTHCDLVSYSAWDSTVPYANNESELRKHLRAALDYLASKMPDSGTLAPDGKPFGNNNVYVGEYGLPEQERGGRGPEQLATMCRGTVEEALDFGCPYVIFWEVFCNECCESGDLPCNPSNQSTSREPVTRNSQCRGFWMRRVDGTYSPAWTYFTQKIGPAVIPPAEFAAVVSSDGRGVTLAWTGSSGEIRYRIERSENGMPFRHIGSPKKGATTYLDTSTRVGANYRYRLRSETETLTSGWFYTDPLMMTRP